MKTNVLMQRELFGGSISQRPKDGFFCVTDLVRQGNKYRATNSMPLFKIEQYINTKSFKEFLSEVENRHGKAYFSGRGRGNKTWAHPLVFIDIALAIDPKLKVEVYNWLFDNLIKFRNDSGDTYKEMAGAVFVNMSNKGNFQNYIIRVANYIKKEVGVSDWQNATEDQLILRDKIHNSIKLLCNVLKSPDQAVRLGVTENLKS